MIYFDEHHDVSKDFRPNKIDARIGKELVQLEGTPEAIVYFAQHCDRLTHYGYWFLLSTLWVSYSGWSELELWKRLFSSNRPMRNTSIMKPSEFERYNYLPYFVTAFRAHRRNETDWIAYTLNPQIAKRFANERGVDTITEYKIRKRDVIALFLRRGEEEIIVPDQRNAWLVTDHKVF